jgi:hypothetical protein
MEREEFRTPVEIIRSQQAKNGTVPRRPRPNDRLGFSFSSKDRCLYTVQSLKALDAEGGFDLIWNDGSTQKGGPELARNWRFKNARLVEINCGVGGGPDLAIRFGLKRLLDLGYDYVGLLENDVVLHPGWFSRLTELFALGFEEGLVCGAASVRGYESRVLEYRNHYSIDWASGAGMVLFSREAAQLILDQYDQLAVTTLGIREFYAELFGVALEISEWNIWPVTQAVPCTLDFGYTPMLYRHGFATLGAIPSLAHDLDFDVRRFLRTNYVGMNKNNAGLAHPLRTGVVSCGAPNS